MTRSLPSRRADRPAIEAGAMALQFKNRRGETYYLQEGKTPTGRPKYYAGKKLTGKPLAALPEGRQFYERPDTAQVIIRAIRPSPITELEREEAEAIVRRASGIKYCIVAIEGDALVVYAPPIEGGEADIIISGFRDAFPALSCESAKLDALRERFNLRAVYTKMLRFELMDSDKRAYRAERWCFRGSIDDWIGLPGYGPLPRLVEQYAPHLGKDSFYELM